MSLMLPVSFKDSEIELYLEIKKKKDISGYIKKLVQDDLRAVKSNNTIAPEPEKEVLERTAEALESKVEVESPKKNVNSFI